MPTYQYACTACDHQLEAVQSFSDDPLTQCPACEGRLRKVFNSVGIVFKGSGFYRTDSRAESRSAANGSTDNGGADTKKVDAKKDAKPDTAAKEKATSTTGGSNSSSGSTSTSSTS